MRSSRRNSNRTHPPFFPSHYCRVSAYPDRESPTLVAYRLSCGDPSTLDFGQIPEEHLYQPSWIYEAKATEERLKMINDGIGRSDSVPCVFLLHCFPSSPDRCPPTKVSQHVPILLCGQIHPHLNYVSTLL